MKLGIMQPYFFPYLGYFDLIHQTDKWVVFDTAQYIRHGWVNRNRLLHPSSGWLYIIVPLKKHEQTASIMDVEVNNSEKWQARLLGQMVHYKKRAPYYANTVSLVQECLSGEETSIARLNAAILERVCGYIGVSFDYEIYSEMDLEIGQVEGAGDWALRISEAMGAEEYLNPPGGEELFDPEAFRNSGIKLRIQEPIDYVYETNGYAFEPALSIIDVLMWNTPGQVKEYLDSRR